MTESGGVSTQTGIFYRNSVAALGLADVGISQCNEAWPYLQASLLLEMLEVKISRK